MTEHQLARLICAAASRHTSANKYEKYKKKTGHFVAGNLLFPSSLLAVMRGGFFFFLNRNKPTVKSALGSIGTCIV
jgi:hypothetical protein